MDEVGPGYEHLHDTATVDLALQMDADDGGNSQAENYTLSNADATNMLDG